MKIGISLEAVGGPIRTALASAARCGARAVQADAVRDLAPDRLTDSARRELRNLLSTYDLEWAALNCPIRNDIDTLENQQPRLEVIRRAMDLAFALGPRTVIVPLPKLPGDKEADRAARLRESLSDLGRHGDRVGTVVALRAVFDPLDKVRDYLSTFDVGSLRLHFDPAALLMNGWDPVAQILPVHDRIHHVQARDARKAAAGRGSREVELGAGDIHWPALVGTLSAVEYGGMLTIDREPGSAAVDELKRSVDLLRRLLPAEPISTARPFM